MPTSYQLLCSVELLHSYFADNIMQNFRIFPDDDTQRILQQHGLMLRNHQNKLEIYFSPQKLSRAQFADLPKLSFYIEVGDPYFHNYTQLPLDQNQKVYVFENQPDKTSLSKQEVVSDEDIAAEDAVVPAQALGLIRLTLSAIADEVPTYQLKFEARRVIWRYFIISQSSSEMSIDAEGFPSTFIDKGLQTLSNNDQAHVFESDPKEPIALAERSAYTVSLKIAQNDGDISVPLPIPSALGLKPVETEGHILFYSDMYVYL